MLQTDIDKRLVVTFILNEQHLMYEQHIMCEPHMIKYFEYSFQNFTLFYLLN